MNLRTAGLMVCAALPLVLTTACGDDDESAGPIIVEAGQVNIQLPDDFAVPTATAPADTAASNSTEAADPADPADPTATTVAEETEDTIPLNESDEPASSRLLRAVGLFNRCLEDEGIEFIGAPDPANPATNDPAYIEGLSTCAARSNIVQVLAEAQAENDNLTPEEIETRNEGYLVWRDCMIDRGWGIPEPVPDEQGRLFNFGGGGDGGGIVAPAGESILDSEDMTDCADEATRATQQG